MSTNSSKTKNHTVEASYFVVRKGAVARTFSATPLLQLDVDSAGNLLGIERIGGSLDDTDLLRIVEVFMPTVVAAWDWRKATAGSILGDHERPLFAAVDALDGAS